MIYRRKILGIAFVTSLIVVTFSAAGTSLGQTGDESKELIANLNKAVIRLRKAYEERDPEKITGLFAKDAVMEIGGPEIFADLVVIGKSAALTTKAKFGEPGEPRNLEGTWLSLIEFQMESPTIHEKKTTRTQTCLIAVSSDEGKTWVLHTGESFYGVFPGLQGRFEIIIRTETLVDN